MNHESHPRAWRAFAPSAAVTLLVIGAAAVAAGMGAAGAISILIAIEVAFSFDNAVVNAKVIDRLPAMWRTLFLTLGMAIAVLGMRVIFPILLVMLTARLSWSEVVHLALHKPQAYAAKLDLAHPMIAAFGGAFLLMLALEFFADSSRQMRWLERLERPMARLSWAGFPATATLLAVIGIALLPSNHHAYQTLVAGCFGLLAHIAVRLGVGRLAGLRADGGQAPSALATFIYLEILDASFSLDGVLGAFAVTNKLVLITAGLSVGALWVRSLTIFIAERGVLQRYVYVEHGAHYTIAVLGGLLLASVVWNIPDVVAGLAGLGFLGSAVVASRRRIPLLAKDSH